MSLSGQHLMSFSDLGSAAAVRLSDLMDIDRDALRIVLERLHRDQLAPLSAAERNEGAEAMVDACQRRWRTMQRATETRRRR